MSLTLGDVANPLAKCQENEQDWNKFSLQVLTRIVIFLVIYLTAVKPDMVYYMTQEFNK